MKKNQEFVARQVVDIAVQLHKKLGPGLLERIYELCFCHELEKRGLAYTSQQRVPLYYDNLYFEDGLRLDILVEDLVIIELKAQENYHPVWEAQLLSYLRLTDKRLGFLMNFAVPVMKQGIKRMINT